MSSMVERLEMGMHRVEGKPMPMIVRRKRLIVRSGAMVRFAERMPSASSSAVLLGLLGVVNGLGVGAT